MAEQESFAFESSAAARRSGSRKKSAGRGSKVRRTRVDAKKPKPRSKKRGSAGGDGGSRRRSTAADLALQQRDISVSEFFAKNRHLLGFDNPAKALLTTIKEGVDNALDACEEAGIIPDVRV